MKRCVDSENSHRQWLILLDHQLPVTVELAVKLNFFVARKQRDRLIHFIGRRSKRNDIKIGHVLAYLQPNSVKQAHHNLIYAFNLALGSTLLTAAFDPQCFER